jgi:hypothetical protein
MAFSVRALGGSKVEVESHAGESIAGDLMTRAWELVVLVVFIFLF